ncbi:type II secretion system F family protein [Aeromicrobium duanguangcaii]|uniref:Type II secretion system F family protein n=1 Tax=Aeromicrobium duanguangcaii TaxID=2968086 RepID=A0ABY5KC46_9ACTN|nr:type II secretion system F family protein [Aeromicrobium duanguangcaii]MCD9154992.1 type II secretion system F family protein [Aeromicrobium duanguangcaii]UUI67603.1 type II secretion system F family protein [Aeromicrobium duanguangcaii]
MTLILLFGAVAGAGVWLLLSRSPVLGSTAASELARLDAQRRRGSVRPSLRSADDEDSVSQRVGTRLAAFLADRGIELPVTIQSDLAVVGKSVESHLGSTLAAAIVGAFAPAIAMGPMMFFGLVSPVLPAWLAIVGALGGAVLAQVQLHSEATERRRDFRHVVSAFLDLVSMNLAGGRGVPEALVAAAGVSQGWGMVRLSETINNARLQGITPWSALGRLGDEMKVEELRDLAAALALVAEDGAKVRDSLTARAASMRQRELADSETRAQERSQSMLIAQLLLAAGFLVFLIFPALAGITGL